MKRIFLVVLYWAIAATPAFAGGPSSTSNATGVGIGVAKASSAAQAVAVSGQGGAGGAGGQGIVNIAGSPAQTTTTQNIHNSGSVSNVPAVFAPGLSAAGLETCLGSVSVGASWLGTGITGGGSIPDPGCAARLDARTLWSMGLKKAAVARLCLTSEIRASMPDVCGVYLPQPAPVYAPVVSPVRYAASEIQYHGGAIMLVEGTTGREHLCNDYDQPGQKCRQWADAKPRKMASKKKHVDPGLPAVATVEDQSK